MHKKTLTTILVVLIACIASVALTEALNLFVLTPEKISVGSGAVSDSDFTTSLNTHFSGVKKITIKVTLLNTDSETHSADVTLSLLDSSGDIINISDEDMTQTLTAADVAGESSTTLNFVFTGAGLVEQYATTSIEVYQIS